MLARPTLLGMRFDVPQGDGAVVCAGYQARSASVESDTPDIARGDDGLATGLAAFNIPERDASVATTGREHLAVGAEVEGPHTAGVSGRVRRARLSRVNIADDNRTV